MALIVLLDLLIICCIVRASRDGLENAFPVVSFFLVVMPLECKLAIPGLFDVNTMRISLLTIVILYIIRREDGTTTELPLRRLMALHIVWAICSTLYSMSIVISAKQMLAQVLEYYLLYFLLVRSITSFETIRRMLFAMMLAMGLCCLISGLEVGLHWSILRVFPAQFWITYNGGLDPLYSELGRGLRVRSTFPHPILFGDALAMSIPLNLYLLQMEDDTKRRLFLWINLVLMFWAIYKTSSRGPWIATAIACCLLFTFMKNAIRNYLAVIGVFVVTTLISRPGIWSTIEGLYQGTTDSSTPVGTSYLYRDALNAAIRNAVGQDFGRALLGYGLGTFRVFGLDIPFLGTVRHWYTCDNNWAAFLYETGYVGLALMIFLLFKALWVAFRNYRDLPKPENEFSGVVFIVLAAFYFLLLSVGGYSWGQQGYMAWILISLVVSQSVLHEESQADLHEVDDASSPILESEFEFHVA